MLFSLARQIECEAQHSINSTPGKNRFLDDHLIFGASVDAPADVGVFAFIVLPDNHEINLTRLPALKWSLNTFEEPDRPQVNILAKTASNGNEKPPKRDVVGDIGASYSAEKDGVKGPQLIEAVGGHHLARFEVRFAAPVKEMPGELESEALPGGIQDANAFRNYFFSDSISCNYGDAESFQEYDS